MLIALDSETTGVDFRHGAKPYFITTANDRGEIRFWEWDVDPTTRQPVVPKEDVAEIEACLFGDPGNRFVFQNPKFDVTALSTVLPWRGEYRNSDGTAEAYFDWPWDRTDDTLIAGHVLASNQPHDLTSMAVDYLGRDIHPYELALQKACNEARNLARRYYPDWQIAKAGKPDMPSLGVGSKNKEAKGAESEKPWKADAWLLRALAKDNGYPEPDPSCKHHWEMDRICRHCDGHNYWVLLREYSNVDSETTLFLWKVMERELLQRKLFDHYRFRFRGPDIAYAMEERGVTISKRRTNFMRNEYRKESQAFGATCLDIAKKYDYKLTLPASASPNKSLKTFIFDVLKLEKRKGFKSKTSAETNPSLDKYAMAYYLASLPEESDGGRLVKTLMDKRQRDSAISYLQGYQRFWVPFNAGRRGAYSERELKDWCVLHPQLNPTGSATLRWSCSNPNEQNISKKEDFNLRWGFGPGPGREWYSLDGQNLELRLPVYECKEPAMLALFERPKDAPYFGSNHLLVSHILHKDLFEACCSCLACNREINDDERGEKFCDCRPGKRRPMIDGRVFKKRYESTWYKWVKNGNFAVCVPMDSEALTRDGWKTYDQIEVGDLVAGYRDGQLEWTPVLNKVKYDCAPLISLSNNHFKAVCTPNHKWVCDSRYREYRGGPSLWKRGLLEAHEISSEDRICLTFPLVDECKLNISIDEAALIGFAYGDGAIEQSQYTGARSQAGGHKVKFRVRLFQKKPAGIKFVDYILNRIGGRVRRSLREDTGMVWWELDSDECRNLWHRACLDRRNPDLEKFVLNLGSEHRKAFLDAVHMAEGCKDPRGNRIFTQNAGSFNQAIKLAIFLQGKNPLSTAKARSELSRSDCDEIREGKPVITGQRLVKSEIGYAPVWCIKTALDTWVMRQGKQIMLTGNTYGAVAESGTADAAYHVPGGQRIIESRFTKIKGLNDYWVKFAERHGYVETMPDITIDPNRGYPLMCTRTEWGRVLPTVPLNYHIQGTAMWWMNGAMIRCYDQIREWRREGFDAYMIMQVHDELVFDFPKRADPNEDRKRSNLWRVKILRDLMEQGGRNLVPAIPTPVSIEYHPHNWAEGISCAI